MTDDGPGFLDRFRFELREPSPPIALAEVAALMAQIEAGKKRIACAPDVFERVRDDVYGRGYGLHYKVLQHPYLQDGQVVVMRSEVEQLADLERAGRELMDSMFAVPERFSDLPWIIRPDPSKES